MLHPAYRLTERHEVTNACHHVHCHSCGVDELVDGSEYVVCGECFHCYRTRRDLRRAYRREASRGRGSMPWLRGNGFGTRFGALRRRVLVPRASRIYGCQECGHDF